MDYERLNMERRGAVTTIGLARPEVRNAFDDLVIDELGRAFEECGSDDGIRAIVLAGEGKVFCAGADIDWMRRSVEKSEEENRAETERLAGMLRTIDECPKPVIGKVHGAAIGGGMGLVSVCDMVVAADDAKFGFTEVRLGIVPAAISTFVLARIGARAARRYFLTGEIFGAAEALRIGLLSEVVVAGDLDGAVDDLCAAICACGPNAVAETKKLIRDSSGLERDEAIRRSAKLIARIRTSPEGQDGLRAFLEKRRPRWMPAKDSDRK